MHRLENRLNLLEEKIKQPNFRENKGLGNEVGYYVFDYSPEHELMVREFTQRLQKKHSSRSHGFTVAVYDLYDLIIDLLFREGFFEICVDKEKKKGFSEIIRGVNELLRMDEDNANNEIIAYIKKNTEPDSVIFLTGVGKCYPILRSHKILNILHQHIDDVPVVMLFPGEYDGHILTLFSEIKDENYYRAFKLID